jgi:hypothetical protein
MGRKPAGGIEKAWNIVVAAKDQRRSFDARRAIPQICLRERFASKRIAFAVAACEARADVAHGFSVLCEGASGQLVTLRLR